MLLIVKVNSQSYKNEIKTPFAYYLNYYAVWQVLK